MIPIIFHFSCQCSGFFFFRKHSPYSLTSSSSFLLFLLSHAGHCFPPHYQFWSFDNFDFTKGYKVHFLGAFFKTQGYKNELHFRKWSVEGWVEESNGERSCPVVWWYGSGYCMCFQMAAGRTNYFLFRIFCQWDHWVVLFIVKQPPLPMKIYLKWLRQKCSQTRSCLKRFILFKFSHDGCLPPSPSASLWWFSGTCLRDGFVFLASYFLFYLVVISLCLVVTFYFLLTCVPSVLSPTCLYLGERLWIKGRASV